MRKYAGHNDWYAWLPFKVCFFKKASHISAAAQPDSVLFIEKNFIEFQYP